MICRDKEKREHCMTELTSMCVVRQRSERLKRVDGRSLRRPTAREGLPSVCSMTSYDTSMQPIARHRNVHENPSSRFTRPTVLLATSENVIRQRSVR